MNSIPSVADNFSRNEELHKAIMQVAVTWRAFDFAADKLSGESEIVQLQRRAATYKQLLAALIDEMVAAELKARPFAPASA